MQFKQIWKGVFLLPFLSRLGLDVRNNDIDDQGLPECRHTTRYIPRNNSGFCYLCIQLNGNPVQAPLYVRFGGFQNSECA